MTEITTNNKIDEKLITKPLHTYFITPILPSIHWFLCIFQTMGFFASLLLLQNTCTQNTYIYNCFRYTFSWGFSVFWLSRLFLTRLSFLGDGFIYNAFQDFTTMLLSMSRCSISPLPPFSLSLSIWCIQKHAYSSKISLLYV